MQSDSEQATGADRGGAATLPTAILPFPVLRVDRGGIVLGTNGVLERELGVAPDALTARRLDDVIRGGAPDAIRAVLEGAVPEGAVPEGAAPAPAECVLTFAPHAGGVPQSAAFQVVPDGGTVWLIGVPRERDLGRLRGELRDQNAELEVAHRRAEAQADEYARVSAQLTEMNQDLEQRARQLKEATEAKSRFLATMSHELRTPLNAVLGYAGLLRDGIYGPLGELQGRAVAAIVKRSKDLQMLIDDVLDLSKIEAGRMEFRAEEFDTAAVLREVEETVAPLAREHGLQVVVRSALRTPVVQDRTKYKQVVMNLVSNALKFTPAGGVVELTVEPGGAELFVTRVRDSGIGIAQENHERIFDAFQQIEEGSTRRYQGTGLGLAITRRLTELLGGTIAVESELGQGATFAVTLPMHGRYAAAAAELPEELGPQLAQDLPVVLAIDDDPEVIALLRDSLASASFRVVGALNGHRGVELARMLRPFAITLDIMMPEKDGWQVLREIKADPALRDIPVIIMSIVAERTLGFSLGVTDYLVKPVDRQVLIDVLRRLHRQPEPRTALLVEDDEDTRTMLRDLLGSIGFEVHTAETGARALASLGERMPAVLFLSLTMPEQEVLHVLEVVANDPRYDRMRTVVITQRDLDDAQAAWLRRAASAVVDGSSGRPQELVEQLRQVLADMTQPADAA